ncbi:TPA: hypothetical protein N0F65_006655 [Lagenidium giganteum]|uniref:Protein kinase domain-containing protein n=1 Tax=Lagenidium giganteum TaxID=4803 RepID=A0AAV2YJQ6_9STRA|nr:TPA: hypothetical protein N0F65_006655 [Lagenidium giganteum]
MLRHARVLASGVLPEDTKFVFDGSSSNLAQHFYNLHKAGVSAKPLAVSGDLPSHVLARLNNYSLVFEKLPSMLQRALVWDTGYYSLDNSVSAERMFSNKRTMSTASTQQHSTGNHSDLLTLLMSDPMLHDRRVQLHDIALVSLIASGSYGEVWLARLHGVDVAVKKLLPARQSTREISDFVTEIQLTATLDHPHIIRMIGVAWQNTDSLCLVLEYAARGDLQSYLHSHRDMLSWPRDMLPMVIGIAQALAYLHARTPAVIHRDLKSKNMLLNDQLQAKLIDFGVSRDKCDETMTAGVGTPYWTAPEVLDGRRYSEKSDIYSFGVFLSEVDTGTTPYSDLKTGDGTKMSTLRVLQLVMAGQVTPTFSSECPARIRNIAMLCLDFQPEKRPSAREIVDVLTGNQPDYMRL